jgi:nitrite reductase (NADH) small subunit
MDLRIARVEAIPEGEGRTFLAWGERVAVFRLRGGTVCAVQASCPHRGGPLADGLTGGSTVICPLHAWKFDLLTGESPNGECRLRTFDARVDDGGFIVLTPPA